MKLGSGSQINVRVMYFVAQKFGPRFHFTSPREWKIMYSASNVSVYDKSWKKAMAELASSFINISTVLVLKIMHGHLLQLL